MFNEKTDVKFNATFLGIVAFHFVHVGNIGVGVIARIGVAVGVIGAGVIRDGDCSGSPKLCMLCAVRNIVTVYQYIGNIRAVVMPDAFLQRGLPVDAAVGDVVIG